MDVELTICGNVRSNRTEVEISDTAGNLVAAVFEDANGWQTELWAADTYSADDLAEPITRARACLMQYPNRRGEGAPEGLTVGARALWLMQGGRFGGG